MAILAYARVSTQAESSDSGHHQGASHIPSPMITSDTRITAMSMLMDCRMQGGPSPGVP